LLLELVMDQKVVFFVVILLAEAFGQQGTCVASICDVQLPGQGSSPVFEFNGTSYGFDNFNCISFSSFKGNGSDIEGRLAVRSNVDLNDWSIGLSISTSGTNPLDRYVPYSLVVGNSAIFQSGTVYPDGSSTSQEEDIFCVGEFEGPAYLSARVHNGSSIDTEFVAAQTYYTQLSNAFASVVDNAVSTFEFGGIFIVCNDPNATSISVTINDTTWSSSTYFGQPENCNQDAQFVFNIAGSNNVSFQGGRWSFTPPEKVLFNIIGSGRTVFVSTEIYGSILAPNNAFQWTGGVTNGQLIFGDVLQSSQMNRLNCQLVNSCVSTTQGITSQILTTQELTTQELTTQELTTQGLTTQELTTQNPCGTPSRSCIISGTTQDLTTQQIILAPLPIPSLVNTAHEISPLNVIQLTTLILSITLALL